MQSKTAKKNPRKKSVKKASRTDKPKRKSPQKKEASQSKSKSKLKKSVARKALRSALAKRATRKASPKAKAKPKKKAAAPKAKPGNKKALKAGSMASKKSSLHKSAKKRSPAKNAAAKKKRPPKKKVSSGKKAPSKAKSRKPISKKAPKAKKPSLKGTEADASAAPAKKVPSLDHRGISKLLSDRYTRHLVIDSGGEYALEIIRGFANNSSDEDMAKKLKIKISDVRATLNKLHSLGIVEYTRHKDSETGWFSYYWFLNVARIKSWVSKKMEEEHRRLDFSNGEHYYCPGCGGASIHDFVSASDFGFKCPTCGSSLDFLSEEKVSEFFPMRSFRKPFL